MWTGSFTSCIHLFELKSSDNLWTFRQMLFGKDAIFRPPWLDKNKKCPSHQIYWMDQFLVTIDPYFTSMIVHSQGKVSKTKALICKSRSGGHPFDQFTRGITKIQQWPLLSLLETVALSPLYIYMPTFRPKNLNISHTCCPLMYSSAWFKRHNVAQSLCEKDKYCTLCLFNKSQCARVRLYG